MTRANEQTQATFQVDLDGDWVLMQWLGSLPTESKVSQAEDPLFEQGIPRSLELFARYGVRATYFVNGLDLLNNRKRRLLEQVAAQGHEIASHGWDHAYFSRLDEAARVQQIVQSAQQINDIFGQPPRGFRAPGYDFDAEGLRLLAAHGYVYDCSALPTSIGPVMEWSGRIVTGRRHVAYPWRQQIFGPTRPYQPHSKALYRKGDSGVVEIPLSVMPWLRLPLSFSYGVLMGEGYLRAGLRWALSSARTVNFLFHLIDFAGPLEHPKLQDLPGVAISVQRRLKIADRVVEYVRDRAQVMRTDALWASITGASLKIENSFVPAGGVV